MTVMRATGERPAVCRRFADHQLVHGHGVEMAREGLPLNVIQRQFGRTDLGVTSVYLEGIDNDEGDQRRPPPPGADDAGGRGSAVSATGSEIIEGISAWSSREPEAATCVS